MTPTLVGRWQTRVLLLLTVGLILTVPVALFAFFWFGGLLNCLKPFLILFFVLFFGFGWDVVYTFLQRRRWDRDWPPVFFLAGGVAEMVPAWVFAWLLAVPWWLFLLHYWLVWWAVFAAMFGPMRVLFPRWRFDGGRWL